MARKLYQCGSVYSSPNGKWWKGRYRVSEVGDDGKPRRVQKNIILGPKRGPDRITKLNAKDKLAKIIRPINNGQHKPEGTMTLEQFVDRFAPFESVRESTLQSYRSEYDLHLKPFFGSMKLCEIEPSHVKDFISQKSKTYSSKTLAELRNLLSVILRQPHEWGWVERNVARLVRLPQGVPSRRRQPTVLNPNEVHRFLAALPRAYCTMLKLVLMTGMSRSELLALRWGRVDFAAGLVAVAEGVVSGRFQETKTKNRVRILPLVEPLLSDLERLYQAQGQPTAEALVFSNSRGKACNPNAIARTVIKPACETAKIPSIAWHDLRHTHGTLVAPFLPDYLVRRQLGHSGSGVTFKVYVHDDLELRRKAVQRLAALLFPNVPSGGLEQEVKEEYKREQCEALTTVSLSNAVN